MENAIKKSIEGGYLKYCDVTDIVFHKGTKLISLYEDDTKRPDVAPEEILLDPEFWQCLGKEMKWPELKQPTSFIGNEWEEITWWEYKWIQFVLHLASGKDADSFFESLLANPLTP